MARVCSIVFFLLLVLVCSTSITLAQSGFVGSYDNPPDTLGYSKPLGGWTYVTGYDGPFNFFENRFFMCHNDTLVYKAPIFDTPDSPGRAYTYISSTNGGRTWDRKLQSSFYLPQSFDSIPWNQKTSWFWVHGTTVISHAVDYKNYKGYLSYYRNLGANVETIPLDQKIVSDVVDYKWNFSSYENKANPNVLWMENTGDAYSNAFSRSYDFGKTWNYVSFSSNIEGRVTVFFDYGDTNHCFFWADGGRAYRYFYG